MLGLTNQWSSKVNPLNCILDFVIRREVFE